MIERHVYIKLKASTDEGRRALAEALGGLARLGGTLAVGLPADPPSLAAWDLTYRWRFDDAVELEAARAKAGPIDQAVAEAAVVVKAWNFELV